MSQRILQERKSKLTVLYGQPERFSTSFQTSQLVARLNAFFDTEEVRVSASAVKRVVTNFLIPFLQRPQTDFLLYGNDGVVDLSHWKATKLLYWYDLTTDWTRSTPRVWEWVQRLRYRNVINADYVFAVSRIQMEVARALRYGREGTVVHIPVGVDCKMFDPERGNPEIVRTRFNLPHKPIVGYLGYLAFWQNRFAGQQLVEAAAKLLQEMDIHFLIVGFGPALHAFKTHLDSMGLSGRFTFTEYVPNELLPHCLAAMDVCVDTLEDGFHSRARSETKLKQYMAMARACVATDIGENRYDLDDGNCGVLVPPDPGSLSEAIAKLLSDPDARLHYGQAARSRAMELFDWSTLASRILSAISARMS